MKPYGLKHKLFFNYVDNHPRKGYVNWWENDCTVPIKKRERQEAKRQIERRMQEERDE